MRRTLGILGLLLLLPVLAQAEETVCLQCHAGQPGHLGQPVDQWRGSIHDRNAISCHGCHGGDPSDMAMAMSPERGFVGVPTEAEIPDFCGKCHVGVKEDYLQSAHGGALGAGGPQCVTCHGSHAVRKATPDLINRQDCTRCHSYGRAEEIKSAVVQTDRMITGLEEDLQSLKRTGIVIEDQKERVFRLRNQFHRVFHSVDVDKVRKETGGIQDQLQEVRRRVEAIQASLYRRKLAGGAAVGLLILAGIVAVLIRRTYHKEEEGG